MERDTQAFLAELENRHGSPVLWRTYATWYGNSMGYCREYGVFFYFCADRFHYQDFERTPAILGLNFTRKKSSEPFVPYIGSFTAAQITATRQVTKAQARRVVAGILAAAAIPSPSVFTRFFRQTVQMLLLSDGSAHFFELMDTKEFLTLLDTMETR